MSRSIRSSSWQILALAVMSLAGTARAVDESSPPTVRFAPPPLAKAGRTKTIKAAPIIDLTKTRKAAPIVNALPEKAKKQTRKAAPIINALPTKGVKPAGKVNPQKRSVKSRRRVAAKRKAAPIINQIPDERSTRKSSPKLVKEAPIVHLLPRNAVPHVLKPTGRDRTAIIAEKLRDRAPRQVLPPMGTYRKGNRVVRIRRQRKKMVTRSGEVASRRPGRRPVIVKLLETSPEPAPETAVAAGTSQNVVRFVQTMFDKQTPEKRLAAEGGRANRESIPLPRNRARHVLLRTVVIARAPSRQPAVVKLPERKRGVPVRLVSRTNVGQGAKKKAPPQPKDPNDPEFKPLAMVSMSIKATGKEFPTNLAQPQFRKAGEPRQQREGASRSWAETMYFWEPAALCHNPLYFEEVNLERYGYTRGKMVQPVASAAHFFGRVVALPYLTAAERPRSCVYTLGHYRPGTWAPYRHHYPPRSTPAGLIQAGVTTGLIFAFP